MAVVCLLLSAAPLRATERRRCGFEIDATRIERMSGGVPLLLAPTLLPDTSAPRVMARRKRLLQEDRRCSERYPETSRYLKSVLERLIRGSRLDGFAASAPPVELVLDCSRSVPLPVARATAGKLMLVPHALAKLAGSEDAVAAVLGHELAHLTLRHPEQLIEATTGAARLSRSQARAFKSAHEREADITGLLFAVNAGYDPHAAVDHLLRVAELAGRLDRSTRPRRLRKPRVHDALAVRMERLQSQIAACGYPRAAALTPVDERVSAELAEPEFALDHGSQSEALDETDPAMR